MYSNHFHNLKNGGPINWSGFYTFSRHLHISSSSPPLRSATTSLNNTWLNRPRRLDRCYFDVGQTDATLTSVRHTGHVLFDWKRNWKQKFLKSKKEIWVNNHKLIDDVSEKQLGIKNRKNLLKIKSPDFTFLVNHKVTK